MRRPYLLLALLSLLQSGCAAMIASRGAELDNLKTKEDVHARFGHPVESGITKDIPFETFRSRSAFRNPMRASAYMMAFGMTLGLSEIISTPLELYQLGRGRLVGHDLRFTYDSTGKVRNATVDGESALLLYRELPEHSQTSKEAEPGSSDSREASEYDVEISKRWLQE